MELNQVIDRLGHFGPYQRRQYLLQGLTLISCCFQLLSIVFILSVPKHRCAVPGLHNDTYRIQDDRHARLVRQHIPMTSSDQDDEEEYASCQLYTQPDLDFGRGQSHFDDFRSRNGSEGLYTDSTRSNATHACSRWVYDDSIFSVTAASQLGLVCDDELVKSHLVMAMMAGQMVGSLLAGPLADWLGRQKVLLISLFLHVVVSMATAFANAVYMFGTLFFLNGMLIAGVLCPSFTLAMELVGMRWRHVACIMLFTFWTLGMALLSLAAYLIRDWRYLVLSGACPAVLYLSYVFCVPESSRWLLAKGKVQQTKAILQKAADVNGVNLNTDSILLLESSDQVKSESILSIVKYPSLIGRLLVVYINWFVCSLTYYGLNLKVGSMSGDIFVNFLLSAVFECLGYVVASLLVMRLGRKTLYCVSIILAGSACLLTIFPGLFADESSMWTVRLLANIGKFGVSGAFGIAWMFTSELFPTSFRASVISTSSFFARAGAVSASYIALLKMEGRLQEVMPQIIFGIGGLVVGVLALVLPETKDKYLPQSVKDATRIGHRDSKKLVARKHLNNNSNNSSNINSKCNSNSQKQSTSPFMNDESV